MGYHLWYQNTIIHTSDISPGELHYVEYFNALIVISSEPSCPPGLRDRPGPDRSSFIVWGLGITQYFHRSSSSFFLLSLALQTSTWFIVVLSSVLGWGSHELGQDQFCYLLSTSYSLSLHIESFSQTFYPFHRGRQVIGLYVRFLWCWKVLV